MSGPVPPPYGWVYEGRRPKYEPQEPRPGTRPLPAPEPFPDGPLRWTLTRLDRQAQEGGAGAEDPRHD